MGISKASLPHAASYYWSRASKSSILDSYRSDWSYRREHGPEFSRARIPYAV